MRVKSMDKFREEVQRALSAPASTAFLELRDWVIPNGELEIPEAWIVRNLRFVGLRLGGASVVFSGVPEFRRLSFENCLLDGKISFRGRMHGGALTFDSVDGECAIDVADLHFINLGTSPTKIAFKNASLGECCFENHSLDTLKQAFEFSNVNWNRRWRLLWRRLLLEEKSPPCKALESRTYGESKLHSFLSEEYGKLEALFEGNGLHSKAIAFHYSKMDKWRLAAMNGQPILRYLSPSYWRSRSRQKANHTGQDGRKDSRWNRLLGDTIFLWLFWISCGYGDRYTRALGWLATTLVLMASVFMLTGFIQLAVGGSMQGHRFIQYDISFSPAGLQGLASSEFWSDALDALLFSFSHLILRPTPRIVISSIEGRLVSLGGQVVGPVLIALFVLSLRRVFRSFKA